MYQAEYFNLSTFFSLVIVIFIFIVGYSKHIYNLFKYLSIYRKFLKVITAFFWTFCIAGFIAFTFSPNDPLHVSINALTNSTPLLWAALATLGIESMLFNLWLTYTEEKVYGKRIKQIILILEYPLSIIYVALHIKAIAFLFNVSCIFNPIKAILVAVFFIIIHVACRCNQLYHVTRLIESLIVVLGFLCLIFGILIFHKTYSITPIIHQQDVLATFKEFYTNYFHLPLIISFVLYSCAHLFLHVYAKRETILIQKLYHKQSSIRYIFNIYTILYCILVFINCLGTHTHFKTAFLNLKTYYIISHFFNPTLIVDIFQVVIFLSIYILIIFISDFVLKKTHFFFPDTTYKYLIKPCIIRTPKITIPTIKSFNIITREFTYSTFFLYKIVISLEKIFALTMLILPLFVVLVNQSMYYFIVSAASLSLASFSLSFLIKESPFYTKIYTSKKSHAYNLILSLAISILWSLLHPASSIIATLLVHIAIMIFWHYKYRPQHFTDERLKDLYSKENIKIQYIVEQIYQKRKKKKWHFNPFRYFKEISPDYQFDGKMHNTYYFGISFYCIITQYFSFTRIDEYYRYDFYEFISRCICIYGGGMLTHFFFFPFYPPHVRCYINKFVPTVYVFMIGNLFFFVHGVHWIINHFQVFQLKILMLNALIAFALYDCLLVLCWITCGLTGAFYYFQYYGGYPLPLYDFSFAANQKLYGFFIFFSLLVPWIRKQIRLRRIKFKYLEDYAIPYSKLNSHTIQNQHFFQYVLKKISNKTFSVMLKSIKDLQTAIRRNPISLKLRKELRDVDKAIQDVNQDIDSFNEQNLNYIQLKPSRIDIRDLIKDIQKLTEKRIGVQSIPINYKMKDNQMIGDTEKLCNLLFNGVDFVKRFIENSDQTFILIEDTKLRYRVPFLQSISLGDFVEKQQTIPAICFVVTNMPKPPFIASLYQTNFYTDPSILLTGIDYLPLSANTQIIRAHFGYENIIQKEKHVALVYIVPKEIYDIKSLKLDLEDRFQDDKTCMNADESFLGLSELENQMLEKASAHYSWDIRQIRKAMKIAKEFHRDEKADSGVPLYFELVSTISLLYDFSLYDDIFIPILLYRVYERGHCSYEYIRKEFNEEIANLIQDFINWEIKRKAYIKARINREEFIKKLLKVENFRVLLLKLVIQYQKIIDLSGKSYIQQRQIAEENLWIYKPIAEKLLENQKISKRFLVTFQDYSLNILHNIAYKI